MGTLVTFYSYKGGVGRSMALANVALLLSRWGYKTLIIDWDLEAPGLEYYFRDYINLNSTASQPGIIDLLYVAYEGTVDPEHPVTWQDYLIKMNLPSGYEALHIITAGARDQRYFTRVQNLDFQNFYLEKDGGFFIEQLRNEWKEQYDFVLIDSRTGVTDIGGVCTIHLPDYLLLFLTTTEQSLLGTIEIAHKASSSRNEVPFDRLPLITVPIPSRFDATEEFRISQSWLTRFSSELTNLYANWLPLDINIRSFLELTKIPYISYFSFGEKLPVVEQGTSDPQGIGYAFETLSGLIAHQFESLNVFIDNRNTYLREVQKSGIVNEVPDSGKSITPLTTEDHLSSVGYELLGTPNVTSHSKVFKARDINLNRNVAIKVLSLPDRLDSDTVTRMKSSLLREAQIVASIDHPNIGRVYHVIAEPLAIVSEWINGKSLQEVLDDKKELPLTEIIRIGIKLAEALDYLHSNAVVHRDIKPSNIFLTDEDEPLLIDFDIAISSQTGDFISMTEDGSSFFVGTPAYSSPEQFLNPSSIKSSSDLFSLGMVLYRLATHKMPFVYGNVPNLYSDNRLPRPERDNLPEPLYTIFCQLLNENPEERQTAKVLIDQLRSFVKTLENVHDLDDVESSSIVFDRNVAFGRGLNHANLPQYSNSENVVLKFITDNLIKSKAGSYKIWVDFVLSSRRAGVSGIVELDLVLINRAGVFIIEIKDWAGKIDSYDDAWIISDTSRHANPLYLVDFKTKIFASWLFQRKPFVGGEKKISVTGLVVLVQGMGQFNSHSIIKGNVFGLDPSLINALSSKVLGYDTLSDNEIERVFEILSNNHGQKKFPTVGNYQILGLLSSNELFDVYEAENINISKKVRLKRYELGTGAGRDDISRLKRNALIISQMGPHPNILTTDDFISDSERYNVYYEVTEWPEGKRLDEMITQITDKMPVARQLEIIEQLCEALSYAHNNGVIHRSLDLRSVFITDDGLVKLGDFDFAKSEGIGTISAANINKILANSIFVAPEIIYDASVAKPVSDLYSLGVIWFRLASLPNPSPTFTEQSIEELGVPDEVKELIRNMTRRAPGNRIQTVSLVLERIQSIKKMVNTS